MSIAQLPGAQRTDKLPDRPFQWRFLCLCLLFLLALILNVCLMRSAPPVDTSITFVPLTPFMLFWLCAFLPYLAAAIIILTTSPPAGRGRFAELGLIFVGAFVLRAMLLLLPPDLSHDSWRYVWDARVTLHGFSPYVYAPGNPQLESLRNFLFTNSRYRNVPTLYPPGAEAAYVLSYLIAPDNLFFLKGIFMVCELITCAALGLLLARRGLDPARVVIYAWCPLPIVEFAIQGHVDALTILCMVLALACAMSQRRSMRILTGFLIALATLTKIYPIVLLLVVLRRRDWALLATCFLTIALAYVPYLLLGHGQVLGFISNYASSSSPNGGIVARSFALVDEALKLSRKSTLVIQYGVDLLLMVAASLLVLWLRSRRSISPEAGALILVGMIFVISPSIFPWYSAALLPWVTLLVVPLWSRAGGLSGRGLALALAWYFPCITVIAYFYGSPPTWGTYYLLAYVVTVLGLASAAFVSWRRSRWARSTVATEN
jgi:Glycosyltransferase family 87